MSLLQANGANPSTACSAIITSFARCDIVGNLIVDDIGVYEIIGADRQSVSFDIDKRIVDDPVIPGLHVNIVQLPGPHVATPGLNGVFWILGCRNAVENITEVEIILYQHVAGTGKLVESISFDDIIGNQVRKALHIQCMHVPRIFRRDIVCFHGHVVNAVNGVGSGTICREHYSMICLRAPPRMSIFRIATSWVFFMDMVAMPAGMAPVPGTISTSWGSEVAEPVYRYSTGEAVSK